MTSPPTCKTRRFDGAKVATHFDENRQTATTRVKNKTANFENTTTGLERATTHIALEYPLLISFFETCGETTASDAEKNKRCAEENR